jgi:hypothetical protein
MSAAFSAIISTAALRCADTRSGIAEASIHAHALDTAYPHLRVKHGVGAETHSSNCGAVHPAAPGIQKGDL